MNHTPLKVYVAGASVERVERAIPTMRALRDAGITITHDWTQDMHESACAEHGDGLVPEADRRRYADEDEAGVRAADVVLLLAPNERGSSGAWTELGIAIGTGKTIVVAGPKGKRSIFTTRAHKMFETDAGAIEWLIDAERQRRARDDRALCATCGRAHVPGGWWPRHPYKALGLDGGT